MTIRDDVRAMLDGPGPTSGAFGDVDAELVGTALGHFADTSSLTDADALAPIVTAASPIPFDPELDDIGGPPAVDTDPVGHRTDADDDAGDDHAGDDDAGDDHDADDHDPDDFDRPDEAGESDAGIDNAAVDAEDRDPDGFDQLGTTGAADAAEYDEYDESTRESFGSGDDVEREASDRPGDTPTAVADESSVDSQAAWHEDPFSVSSDPVADAGIEDAADEFVPADIDDEIDGGFGEDPAGDFDAIG
ncbi:MAG: hypothetical protein AB8G14_01060 [Ilumatobacter sp.]